MGDGKENEGREDSNQLLVLRWVSCFILSFRLNILKDLLYFMSHSWLGGGCQMIEPEVSVGNCHDEDASGRLARAAQTLIYGAFYTRNLITLLAILFSLRGYQKVGKYR